MIKILRYFTTVMLLTLCFGICCTHFAFAQVYSHEPGWVYKRDNEHSYGLFVNVSGYNKTHGIFKDLKCWTETYKKSGNYYYRIYFELPDDGSEWEIFGRGYITLHSRLIYDRHYFTNYDNSYTYSFYLTINTPGSFTGISLGQAVSAANAAKTAAEIAKASADAAHTAAQNAANQTIYNGNSAAYWAYLASVNTGTDTIAPTIKKVQGQNGATCTTSSSFTVVISASDNGPDSNLRYRAICGSFDSGWKSGNKVTISGLTNGAKTAIVKVSDNPTSPDSGNIAQETFTFFKV